MTRAQRKLRETNSQIQGTVPKQSDTPSQADHLFRKLLGIALPAKEHLESYLRYKVRLNHKPRTLYQSFTTAKMFLTFYQGLGKYRLEEVTKAASMNKIYILQGTVILSSTNTMANGTRGNFTIRPRK